MGKWTSKKSYLLRQNYITNGFKDEEPTHVNNTNHSLQFDITYYFIHHDKTHKRLIHIAWWKVLTLFRKIRHFVHAVLSYKEHVYKEH